MDRESQVIHEEMEQTRSSLTDKLESLERKVTNTVQDATDVVQEATSAVTNTVETVQDAVQETVQTVKESVHEAVETVTDAFDVSRQVRRHPWLMFGGAVATGYLGERWLRGRGPEQIGKTVGTLVGTTVQAALGGANGGAPVEHTNGKKPAHSPERPISEPRQRASEPRQQGSGGLTHLLGAELDELKKLAISAALGVARDVVMESMDEDIGRPFAQIMDSITTKLGGQPLSPVGEKKSMADNTVEHEPSGPVIASSTA